MDIMLPRISDVAQQEHTTIHTVFAYIHGLET